MTTRYNKRGSNKRGSNKRGSNKRGSNKRGSNKRGSNKRIARGKMNNKPPRRLNRSEYLTPQDIQGIILTGGDGIEVLYLDRTGHNLVEDLTNITLDTDKERVMIMGSTLYNQAVWKLGNWLKGNYGDDNIT